MHKPYGDYKVRNKESCRRSILSMRFISCRSLAASRLALSGASESWSSGLLPQIGTNTLTLSAPLVLNNQRLYVGNAYSLPGNWSGSITFNYSTAVASQPVPVPTLSEWGVIVMGALMVVFAFTRMRKKG